MYALDATYSHGGIKNYKFNKIVAYVWAPKSALRQQQLQQQQLQQQSQQHSNRLMPVCLSCYNYNKHTYHNNNNSNKIEQNHLIGNRIGNAVNGGNSKRRRVNKNVVLVNHKSPQSSLSVNSFANNVQNNHDNNLSLNIKAVRSEKSEKGKRSRRSLNPIIYDDDNDNENTKSNSNGNSNSNNISDKKTKKNNAHFVHKINLQNKLPTGKDFNLKPSVVDTETNASHSQSPQRQSQTQTQRQRQTQRRSQSQLPAHSYAYATQALPSRSTVLALSLTSPSPLPSSSSSSSSSWPFSFLLHVSRATRLRALLFSPSSSSSSSSPASSSLLAVPTISANLLLSSTSSSSSSSSSSAPSSSSSFPTSAAFATPLPSYHINQSATLLQATTTVSDALPAVPSQRIFKRRATKVLSTAKAKANVKTKASATKTPLTLRHTTAATTTERIDHIFFTEVYDIPPNATSTTFWQKYGRILLIAIVVSVSIACSGILIIIIVYRRRAANAITAAAAATSNGQRRRQQQQQQKQRQRQRPRSYQQKQKQKQRQEAEGEEEREQERGHQHQHHHHYHRRVADKKHNTAALALPIPLLPEDQTLLPTEPEHSVPMLSVQTAGCAGMERLGVPTRTSLSTPTDEREPYRCRMRVDALQARELLAVRSETVIRSNNGSSGSNIGYNTQQYQQKQQHSHQQQQQQYPQRMTTRHNAAGSVSGMSASHANTGSSGSGNGNGNSKNNNSIISSVSGNNVARGGIEATTLKYGNTGSGSNHKGEYSSCSSSASSCGSVSSHSNDHHQHYQYQLQQQQTPRCPHHVPLPDSEYGQDRHLQIRTSYQQSEITRSYTKPPPNKTVRDVPTDQLSCYRLSSNSTLHAAASAGAPPYPNHGSCHGANVTHHHHQYQQQSTTATTKSKPNAITKFFSRISSPKSPTALAANSAAAATSSSATATATGSPTCSSLASSASMSSSASSLASAVGSSSVSTSSSASSLAAAPLPTLPISNAASVKSTVCSYGAQNSNFANAAPTTMSAATNNILAGLAPTNQLLTSLGTPATATAVLERIPTPPLSVSVPIALHQQHYYQQQQHHQHQHHHYHHHHQQQQQQQHEQAHTSNSSGLQILKSSSCNLPASSLLCGSEATSAEAVAGPSTTAISRNNSNSSIMSCSCNCNSKNCAVCSAAATTTTT